MKREIELVLLKLADGGRVLRFSEPQSGLCLEKRSRSNFGPAVATYAATHLNNSCAIVASGACKSQGSACSWWDDPASGTGVCADARQSNGTYVCDC